MGLTASIKELEEAIKRLNDGGRWVALKQLNALLDAGYGEKPISETWTGYYSSVEKDGNIVYPKKIIDGINWAARTFNNSDRTATAQENESTRAVPKPLKSEKKKTVIIEAMPWEPLPEKCPDYRPYLQRDGLILFSWEIHGDEIRIVWLAANGGMRRYQTLIDNESELTTICPEKKYTVDHYHCHTLREPDFIIYAAPPSLTANTRNAFIAKLKAAGVSINFDYEFTLGKQKAAREMAVFDKIENRQYITPDEAEFLEVYRQLSNEEKMDLIRHMEALLNEQEMEIKNA